MNDEEKIASDEWLRRKHLSKTYRQRHRMRLISARAQRKRDAAKLYFGRRSKLIKLLSGMAGTSKRQSDERRIDIAVPASFSVLDDAESALRLVADVAQKIRARPKVEKFYVDQKSVVRTDLGANALLDMLFVELGQEYNFNERARRVEVGGRLPDDERANVFIRAIGIIHHLKVAQQQLRGERREKVRVFEARRAHYEALSSARSQTHKDIQVQRFSEYVDGCLQTRQLELSIEGKARICACLGEILANAEEHSGMSEWSVLGYVDLADDPPVCEFTVFNFGAPISKTLGDLAPDSFTAQQIAPFVDKHLSKGFLTPEWRLEDLLTVVALQGAVSSKNHEDTDTRGNGTVDFIRFFQAVKSVCAPGDTTARMVVLSGGTYILFDGRYRIEEVSPGLYQIAFNPTNNLSAPPDRQNVRAMKGVRFPGTMISVRFPMGDVVRKGTNDGA